MKTTNTITKKVGLLLLAVTLSSASIFGATFTAVSSGSWSSSATWGVSAPPYNLSTDQVIIPVGVNVTLDGDVNVSGLLASLSVQGTLSGTSVSSVTVSNMGTVTGTGTIEVGNLNINTDAVIAFTGSLTADVVAVTAQSVQVAANVMVNQALQLTSGSCAIGTGGSLGLASGGTIVVSGGALTLNGGTLGLSGTYNVIYNSGSTNTGIELSGPGLSSVTVDVSSGNTVTLHSDLAISGTLSLTSGTLSLNGFDLTITGDVSASGSGTVSSGIGSCNITINANGGISGALNFTSGTNIINSINITVGAGNQVQIGGTVEVSGNIQITSGTLNFSGASLIISGTVGGSGTFSGNASANLSITTAGGLQGTINFSPGAQILNNLTVNVGTGNSAAIGTNLTVMGTVALMRGCQLNISGISLTTNGSITGTGALVVNSNTSLMINGSGMGSDSVSITGGSLGNLSVNAGSSGTVILGSDLTVSGNLSLQSGTLVLNNYDLTIAGNISSGGSGTISSSLGSDITISTGTSPSGSISFTAGANVVGNLSVNIGGGAGAQVIIGSDLVIDGNLNLINGNLNIGSNSIALGAGGSITGAGIGSYIITGAGGSLGMQVTAGTGTSVTFPVGTSVNFCPANVQLNSGSASGMVEVGVVAGVLAQGTTGADISITQPTVNATWHVASDISSNLNLNLEVMWAAAMEVNGFNNSSVYISHYTGGSWDVSAAASATVQSGGMFSLQRDNITSLSPFAVFDQHAVTGLQTAELPVLSFKVYPNPASDHIVLQSSAVADEAIYVEVTNVIGEVVDSYVMRQATLDISLSHLQNGNYFIRFHNDKLNTVRKFMKR